VEVHLVPCLSDNYCYLLHQPGSKDAVVVDASEEAPVLQALEKLGLNPLAILATHHHPDHVGVFRTRASLVIAATRGAFRGKPICWTTSRSSTWPVLA
jgi:hydroxyacylglutathione hydrolase